MEEHTDNDKKLFTFCRNQEYDQILELLPKISNAQILRQDEHYYLINTIHALARPQTLNVYDKHIDVVKALMNKGALLEYQPKEMSNDDPFREYSILADSIYYTSSYDKPTIHQGMERIEITKRYTKFLIDNGADINGRGVLFKCIRYGYIDLANEIIDKGTMPDMEIIDELFTTHIDTEIILQLFHKLISMYPQIKLMTIYGNNIIMNIFATQIMVPNIELAKQLIDYYESIDECDYIMSYNIHTGKNIIDYAYHLYPSIITKIKNIYKKKIMLCVMDEQSILYEPFYIKGGSKMLGIIIDYLC